MCGRPRRPPLARFHGQGKDVGLVMYGAQDMAGHTPEPRNACFDGENPDGSKWAIRDSVGTLIADSHDQSGPNEAAAYGEANPLHIPVCMNALRASALP